MVDEFLSSVTYDQGQYNTGSIEATYVDNCSAGTPPQYYRGYGTVGVQMNFHIAAGWGGRDFDFSYWIYANDRNGTHHSYFYVNGLLVHGGSVVHHYHVERHLNVTSVEFNCPDGSSNEYEYICHFLAVEVAPAGWGHKFIGVLGADIGKVNGVPIADIGKIKGLAI